MSALLGRTTNFRFAKINFDVVTWHDLANGNYDDLDAILTAASNISAVTGGVWKVATAYTNETVVDPDLYTLWSCQVAHTSASSGSFADDRAAHPTYWAAAVVAPTTDPSLIAFAGLTAAADKLPYFTGAASMDVTTLTSFARTFLDDADAATVRTTLGLVIGTNVQAYDAELAALAGLTSAADKGIMFSGAGAASTYDLTAYARTLLDDADADAALATLTALKQGTWTFTVPATAMYKTETAGCEEGKKVDIGSGKPNFYAMAFDATSEENAQFALRWPKSLGTATVKFTPIWAHPSTTTNFGVVFGFSASGFTDDDAANAAFGTEQTSADTGGTTSDIYIGPQSSAVTIGNSFASRDWVIINIARKVANGSDTMAVDAYLLGVEVEVSIGAKDDA